ncbi:MAG: response regulator [Bacteroidota bacterium]
MGKELKTVLLVDDEPNILVPLEFLIKGEGYRTLTASNGKQALRIMETVQPDLVLLDVMMPEMNGFETAREIRQNPEWAEIHIIFLTAKGTHEDKINGYTSGGEIYLTKPFNNDELLSTVNEILEFG